MPLLRTVLRRSAGHPMGPIRRLIDPQALGAELKPFVFLDVFDAEIAPGFGFGLHPHSGIATLTWQPDSDVAYADTTGQQGVLQAGGLEWMNAAGGAWHQGRLLRQGRIRGFQLWVAMPPGIEDGQAFGQYVPPTQVPTLAIEGGQLQVLLGAAESHGQRAASPIVSHQRMNQLVVTLEAGARWRFDPPHDHDVAFAYALDGQALVQGLPAGRELLVLGPEGRIEVEAGSGPARVLVGTALRHPHALVLGPSSVHTNPASLQASQQRIRAIGARLHPRPLPG